MIAMSAADHPGGDEVRRFDGTDMTSRASISSEMRMAPSSAVKPAPTWAAKATPAMSGVTSRVLAKRR